MIAPAFFRSAAREGFAGFKITDVGFCPLPDVTSPRFPDFSRPMPDFIELLKRTPSIRHVVVACFWEMHADGYSRRLKRVEFRDSGYDGSGVAYNPTSLRHGLERLFDMFPDRQFALIEDVLTGPEFDPNTAARLIHVKGGQSLESLGISRRKYDGQLSPYRSIFAAMVARPNVRVYSVADSLCTADFCPGWRGGRPAYRDFDHISETGALVLSGVFEKVLSDFAAPPRGESRHADITKSAPALTGLKPSLLAGERLQERSQDRRAGRQLYFLGIAVRPSHVRRRKLNGRRGSGKADLALGAGHLEGDGIPAYEPIDVVRAPRRAQDLVGWHGCGGLVLRNHVAALAEHGLRRLGRAARSAQAQDAHRGCKLSPHALVSLAPEVSRGGRRGESRRLISTKECGGCEKAPYAVKGLASVPS